MFFLISKWLNHSLPDYSSTAWADASEQGLLDYFIITAQKNIVCNILTLTVFSKIKFIYFAKKNERGLGSKTKCITSG